MIAVILHSTFTRWEQAMRTIHSFRDDFKIYFSYTGELDFEKIKEMDALNKSGHEAYYLGWDTSPAITRNFLIDRVKEPYILKVDDDFLWNEDIFLNKTICLLNKNKKLGLIGFSVYSHKYKSQFIYNVEFKKDVIKLNKPKNEFQQFKELKYQYVDITPDCWIAKREIFPECNYDERYHVSQGLHTDFFMHIKYNTGWNVAYTPGNEIYTFKHEQERDKYSFYNKKRFRSLGTPEQGKDLIFLPKWGAKKITK